MPVDFTRYSFKNPHKKAFEQNKRYFPTQIQAFQFYDKYARFNHDLGRRETWSETVARVSDYLRELSENKLPNSVYNRIYDYILTMKAMPSMRLIATAGEAARRNNAAIYNCSYLPLESIEGLVEMLTISLAGCGVGYSVESDYVNQLPAVKVQTGEVTNHVVEDTAEGWVNALRLGLNAWFDGKDMTFDYSKIRPAGSVLRVKGGRASGYKPLAELLDFARQRILDKQGQKLSPLNVHDIACQIGKVSISGGVRRTALIALFDFDDEEMKTCKDGEFWIDNPQRVHANNSQVWTRRLSLKEVRDYVDVMDKSGRGEPGIFNRFSAINTRPTRRKLDRFGTNPCGEINLRPYEFCNLSIVVARKDDTLQTLLSKVEVATIIGTIQSLATNFDNLRPIWRKNCEEERLLGVDITGQLDCPALNKDGMDILKRHSISINAKYAKIFGINQSASVTCVKPSGNSSVLLDCSAGIHARWAEYYIRRVRVSAVSPLFKVLQASGVPMLPENGQEAKTANTWVVSFPCKSPTGAITRNNRTAIDQLDYWLMNKKHWTEHNPSCTVTYKPHELDDIANWLFENQGDVGGLTFLPHSDANYEQMPYEEITRDKFLDMMSKFPRIDFSLLYEYEKEDYTTSGQELACFAGGCEI